MKRRAFWVWTALVAAVVVVRVHADGPSWVGKVVILKRTGLKIGYSDANDRQVYVATLHGLDYPVHGEQDGWLLVPSGFGTEGWLDKDEAVLLDDAVAYFTARIEWDSDDADAFNRRGWARKLAGVLGPAIEDLGAAIRLAPEAAVFNNRAATWYDQGEYDRAIQDCNEALRLDAKYHLALVNRGNAWSAKKAYDKALADYNEVLRVEPKNAAAFNNRGNVRACQRSYDAAIRDYSEAIRLEPKFAAAFNNRGQVWALKNDHLRAIRDYSLALKLDPSLARAENPRQTRAATMALDWLGDFGDDVMRQTQRLGAWIRQPHVENMDPVPARGR